MDTFFAVLVYLVFGGFAWLAYREYRRAKRRSGRGRSLSGRLAAHFAPTPLAQTAVAERRFAAHLRADFERALKEFVAAANVVWKTGLTNPNQFEQLNFSALMDRKRERSARPRPGPWQYDEIDVGEAETISTLQNGLWLAERNGVKFAVVYSSVKEFGPCGGPEFLIQIATAGDAGATLAKEFFRGIEHAVENARCYRGKVLSFDRQNGYLGRASAVVVHRLEPVPREDVILPQQTLDLLDRNTRDFIANRERLAQFKLSTKKGLLFYGPPGVGKTHTIRYLIGACPGHTTFLITAEQVGVLEEYMTLARLLQPSIVVIEDVDLIARAREEIVSPGVESLLNKLLNEMDGLKEDCRILFILTTNRRESLEEALASRPGRIDQAIEFPRPDAVGREKLVKLYSGGLPVPDSLGAEIVRRTDGASAAFIKEVMRRTAQRYIERNGTDALQTEDARGALEEMLMSGAFNLNFLGGETEANRETSPLAGNEACGRMDRAAVDVASSGGMGVPAPTDGDGRP